jgi:tetratricopeptide (TPR) repeat protein
MSASIIQESTTTQIVGNTGTIVGRQKFLVAFIVMFGLGVMLYWPSLDGPRLFDDNVMLGDVGQAPTMRQVWGLTDWLRPETRPLVRLTFGIESCLFGDSMSVHRLGNVLVHVLAAIVLFGLVRTVFQRTASTCSGRLLNDANQTALAVSLLWFVHPLQSAAVAYVAQRGESLMGLFFFLYLRCLAELITTGGTRWLLAAICVFCAGLSSKTVMITAPLVGLLMDRAFYSGSWKDVFRGQWRLLLLPAVGSAFAVMLLMPGILQGHANVGFGGNAPPIELHLAAQAKVIWLYVFQSIWPQWLSVDHAMRPPQYVSDHLGWILLTTLLLIAIAALFWSKRCAPGFLLLAPICVLAVTSSFIPTADLWVDHRMYVPLACVILIVVIGLRRLLVRIQDPRKSAVVFITVVGIAGIALAGRTWLRAADYATGIAIWRSAIAENPDNDRAMQALIGLSREHSPPQSPMPLLNEALRVAEQSGIVPTVALGRLGELHAEAGEPEKAIRLLGRAIRFDEQHFLVGYRGARRNTERSGMHVNMSLAFASLGQLSEALEHVNLAFYFADGSADARALAGSLSLQAGDIAAAENHFQRALELRPGWKDVEADLERIRQLR